MSLLRALGSALAAAALWGASIGCDGATDPLIKESTAVAPTPAVRLPCEQVPPEVLSGTFRRLADGRSALVENHTLVFTNGSAGGSFSVPEGGSTAVSVLARSNGQANGYRATVHLTRDGAEHLTISRVTDGEEAELGRRPLPSPIVRTIRVRLDVTGTEPVSLRATVWPAGHEESSVELAAIDPGTDRITRPGWGGLRALHAGTAPITIGFSGAWVTSPEVRHRRPRLGIYNGMAYEGADALTDKQFGDIPALASGYYLHDRGGPDNPHERARVRAGISPMITITTGGAGDATRNGVRPTQYLAALAASLGGDDSHPELPAAIRWFHQYLAELSRLADVDPSVPIYATIEHEFGVKVIKGRQSNQTHGLVGSSADPVAYAAVFDEFVRRIRALRDEHPNLRSVYWLAGVSPEWPGHVPESAVNAHLTEAPDVIAFDPYAFASGDQTLASIAADEISRIWRQRWYIGQPIGLAEFGMKVEFGDAALARFYTDLPGKLANLNLEFGILFNRIKSSDLLLTGRPDGVKLAGAVTAFAEGLTCEWATG